MQLIWCTIHVSTIVVTQQGSVMDPFLWDLNLQWENSKAV